LTMGALIIIVEGPSPPIAISVSSVVFGWPWTLIVTGVFAVRESICCIH
jgi:hypothetical protein